MTTETQDPAGVMTKEQLERAKITKALYQLLETLGEGDFHTMLNALGSVKSIVLKKLKGVIFNTKEVKNLFNNDLEKDVATLRSFRFTQEEIDTTPDAVDPETTKEPTTNGNTNTTAN